MDQHLSIHNHYLVLIQPYMLWLGRQPSLGEGVSPFILRVELRGWGVYNDYGVINRFIVSLTNTRNLINEYLCYSIWGYNGSVGITLPFFYMPRSWQHHQVLSDNLFPHPLLFFLSHLLFKVYFVSGGLHHPQSSISLFTYYIYYLQIWYIAW